MVFAQFIGFLFIGVLLFAFYGPQADPAYAQLPSGVATLPVGDTFQRVATDTIFPDFITRHMPTGLSGLVVAAIFDHHQ